VLSSLHSDFQGRASELSNIFVEFLKGSGVSCPAIFKEAKTHFSLVVDLTTIDTFSFRSRMFCWAANGSPSIQVEGSPIQVCLSLLYFYHFLITFCFRLHLSPTTMFFILG
jgi:hypothetical protein